MQSPYSWCGTKLTLILEDEVAEHYNRVADAFANINSQEAYSNPSKPFYLSGVDDDDLAAWNGIADIINKIIEINGGTLDIADEDVPSNHLIKL